MADTAEVEYLPMAEAARALGCAPSTLSRRARREGLAVFTNPRDRRGRLLLRAEVEAAAVPRRIPTHRGGKEEEPTNQAA